MAKGYARATCAKSSKPRLVIFSRKGYDGTQHRGNRASGRAAEKPTSITISRRRKEIYNAVIAHLLQGWDDALKHISPDREPVESLEAYVRAKLDYARRNAEESRVFAAEILTGAKFLSRKDRGHMRLVTKRHAEIVEHWIARGKIDPVDPRHLFIILSRSATQFYADFETLACDALEKPRLRSSDCRRGAHDCADGVARIAALLRRARRRAIFDADDSKTAATVALKAYPVGCLQQWLSTSRAHLDMQAEQGWLVTLSRDMEAARRVFRGHVAAAEERPATVRVLSFPQRS